MTAWPDDTALTPADLEAARHEGREDREASDLLSAMLDEWDEKYGAHDAAVRERWKRLDQIEGAFARTTRDDPTSWDVLGVGVVAPTEGE